MNYCQECDNRAVGNVHTNKNARNQTEDRKERNGRDLEHYRKDRKT